MVNWLRKKAGLRDNSRALGFIIVYSMIIGAFIIINKIWPNIGLNLASETDRAVFQGIIALGLALFILFQFELDYRNRRRNILYEKQIDALLEFRLILDGILIDLNSLAYSQMSIQDLFEGSPKKTIQNRRSMQDFPFERYIEFINLGKIPFVKNLLNRKFILKEGDADRKLRILRLLKDKLKSDFESKLDRYSEIGNLIIFISDDLSLDTRTLDEIIADRSSSEKMTFNEIQTEMHIFLKILITVIDQELDIL